MSELQQRYNSLSKPLDLCANGEFDKLFTIFDEVWLNSKVPLTGFKPRSEYTKDRRQALHYAAAHGNLKAVSALVEKYKCDPNCNDRHGATPLHYAAYYGRFDIVKYLVGKGCEPNKTDKTNRATALHYVCYKEKDPSLPDTTLPTICKDVQVADDHIEVMKFLIDSGWDLNLKDKFDHKPHVAELMFVAEDLHDLIPAIKLCDLASDNIEIKLTKKSKLINVERIKKYCTSSRFSQPVLEYLVKICSDDVYSTALKYKTQKETLLDFACQHDLFFLMKLIAIGNEQSQDCKQRTPLHVACMYGKRDFVSFLIERQCNVQRVDSNGQLPLHVACRYSDVEIVKLVSECDVNQLDKEDNTPLHLACMSNNEEIIKYLVDEKQCSLEKLDKKGNTPLHIACSYSDIKVAKLVSDYYVDKQKNRPLHLACKSNNEELIKYLVEEKQCSLKKLDEKGNAPLHIACSYSNIKVVKLVSDCDVDKQNKEKNTPLHLACMRKYPSATEIIQFLTKEKQCNKSLVNSKKQLPIHIVLASNNPSLEVVEMVAPTNDINMNKKDFKGCTPIYRACSNPTIVDDIFEYLINEKSCKLNVPNNKGRLPLHNMISLIREEVTQHKQPHFQSIPRASLSNTDSFDSRLLMDIIHFSDIDVDKEHNTLLLQYACSSNNLNLLRFFIFERKCDVNIIDSKGNLPLHTACEVGSLEMVKLVSIGVSELNIKNNHGYTPLHMIASNKKESLKIMRYLVTDRKPKFKPDPDLYHDLDISLACANELNFDLLSALATEKNVNGVKKSGAPLRIACENDNMKAVKFFTEKLKCIKNIPNKDTKKLPLHFACCKSVEMVELVIQETDVNAVTADLNTPLHFACQHSKIGIIELLINKYECDQSMKNKKMELPLHLACRSVQALPVELQIEPNYLKAVNSKGHTPLYIACKRGEYAVVKGLLDNLEDNIASIVSCDIINLSCQTENVSLVNYLLEKHDVEELNMEELSNQNSDTFIHTACDSGSLDVVKCLIDKGLDPRKVNKSKELPLHIACGISLELVKLTSHKCTAEDLEAQTVHYLTPLHIAAYYGLLDVVKYLIENKKCSPLAVDGYGNNALAYACGLEIDNFSNISPDVARYLVESGCNPADEYSMSSESMLKKSSLIQKSLNLEDFDLFQALVSINVNCQDNLGHTPLMLVSLEKSTESIEFTAKCLEYLKDKKCDQLIQNKNKDSALHLVCECDNINAIKNFDYSSDALDIKNESGNTPLHTACKNSSRAVLEYFFQKTYLSQGMFQQKNVDGFAPIHLISSKEILELILVYSKCAINVVDNNRNSSLHILCLKMDENTLSRIKLLLDSGASRSIRNNTGNTPLHTACSVGNHEAVKLLGNNCVSVKNNDGNTPLHLACQNGDKSIDIVIALALSDGYDLSIQNSSGDTPVHIACRLACFEVVHHFLTISKNGNILMQKNGAGFTPFYIALKCLHKFKYFKEVKRSQSFICSIVDSYNGDMNTVYENEETLLHLACKAKNTDSQYLVKCFLERGADPERVDSQMQLPLHIAASKSLQLVKLCCHKICTRSQLAACLPFHKIANDAEFANLKPHLSDTFNAKSNKADLTPGTDPKSDPTSGTDNPNSICNDPKAGSVGPKSDSVNPKPVTDSSKLGFVSSNIHLSPELSILPVIDQKDSLGNTPLHIACSHGRYDVAQFLLRNMKCNPNVLNNNTELPLHCACRTKSRTIKLIKLVSSFTSEISIQDANGDTPFHLVCKTSGDIKGKVAAIKILLKHCNHGNISTQNNLGETPLHIACRNSDTALGCVTISIQDANGDTPFHLVCKTSGDIEGKVAAIKILLKHCNHGNISTQNNLGETPLHIACRNSDTALVKCLTACNPGLRLKETPHDTALHIACRYSSNKTIKCLVRSDHKTDIKTTNAYKELPMHLICQTMDKHSLATLKFLRRKCFHECNKPNENRDTLLHLACRNKHVKKEVIQYLIADCECDISVSNIDGDTPLHIACRNEDLSVEILELLASSNKNINKRNKQRNTALHECCIYQQNEDIFKFLLEHGRAKCTLSNGDGQYPIHLACRYQSLAIVKLFNSNGITAVTKDEDTVLHEACKNTKRSHGNEIIQHLLQFKLQLNLEATNEDEDLALHIACRNSILQDPILEELMSSTDENSILQSNKSGDTPLHELIKTGHSESIILSLFEKSKRNLEIFETKKETPLHLACKHNLVKVVRNFLKENVEDYINLEDENGQTPLTLTTNQDIVGLLLDKGADAQPLYQIHKEYFQVDKPPQTPVSMLVVGDPCTGKTTLVSSLKKEDQNTITETHNRTAGIVPNDFNSQFYGQVIMYDFAGQPEYYASHDAVIHNTIKNSPPIVLLLVDLKKSTQQITDSIFYWSKFIKNRLMSQTDKAHFYIICSHADLIKNPSSMTSELLNMVEKEASELSAFDFQKLLSMDCRKPNSFAINELRKHLASSTKKLRHKAILNFKSHCLSIFIKKTFKDTVFIRLDKFIYEARNTSESQDLVPTDPEKLIPLCEELHENGIIIFLKHPNIPNSGWLILDKDAVLKDISGVLFAPSSFPEYAGVYGSNTGVVCLSRLQKVFRQYDPNMLIGYLCHMEYCHEIVDEKVVTHMLKSSEEKFNKSEQYYFFPNVIKVERPSEDWNKLKKGHLFGWVLECNDRNYFTPYFVQVLLLRLIFGSTEIKHLPNSALDIHSMSVIWKSGVLWDDSKGIDTLVDVIDNSKVLVLVNCEDELNDKVKSLQHRSSLLAMIREIRRETCPAIETTEYLIIPEHIHHPLKENYTEALVPIRSIISTVANRDSYVYSTARHKIEVQELLFFDPYSCLCKHLCDLILDPIYSAKKIDHTIKVALSHHFHDYFQVFVKIIKPLTLHLQKIDLTSLDTHDKFLKLLKLWLTRIGSTHESFRKKLDDISIFNFTPDSASGHGALLKGIKEPPACSCQDTSLQITQLPDCSEVIQFLDDLDDKELIKVGTVLGLRYPKLKRMKDLPGDMVTAWLREDDSVTEKSGSPRWESLIKALEKNGFNGIASKIKREKNLCA